MKDTINRQSNKWHYLHCSNCGASNALTAFPTVRNQALILFSGSLSDSCIYICIYIYILLSQLFQLFFSNRKLQATLLCKCKTLGMIIYIYIESTVYLHVYIYTLYITMYSTYTKYIQIQ